MSIKDKFKDKFFKIKEIAEVDVNGEKVISPSGENDGCRHQGCSCHNEHSCSNDDKANKEEGGKTFTPPPKFKL